MYTLLIFIGFIILIYFSIIVRGSFYTDGLQGCKRLCKQDPEATKKTHCRQACLAIYNLPQDLFDNKICQDFPTCKTIALQNCKIACSWFHLGTSCYNGCEHGAKIAKFSNISRNG
jgi:hypothetical protein